MITGLNLNFLKLLPKLKSLSLRGMQRRNAGACWTPRITDLDLETISLLSGLEELDLGVGIGLGMGGKPAAPGGGNCRVTGGLQVTDLGVAKLPKLKNLKRLNVSGARLTPEGIKVLQELAARAPQLVGMPVARRLPPPECSRDSDASSISISRTRKIGDQALQQLAQVEEPESSCI